MDNLPVFQEFVAEFPQWRLWLQGENRYQLTFQPVTGYDTYGYNPETTNNAPLRSGAIVGFYLTAVTEVKFDGTSLNFKASGYSYQLDGKTGKAAVKG